ncbi:heavy-metal-associated domain-containing protein [Nocardia sp. NBC_01009]|uniref:heavy-metal-associated domain-containing protein n=1 Tax=Nocardia sp. NBC_01009 TaxID=2975996 RepID=UPI0038670534|nr:heavy-metal-associated domain-containing protein [Nocardia sp. NBC_01009]
MSTAATTATVTVTGMTCGCCVNSVSKEVGKIAGVTAVDVDLATGRVTVDSAAPVEPGAIAAAVDKAGYQVTAD